MYEEVAIELSKEHFDWVAGLVERLYPVFDDEVDLEALIKLIGYVYKTAFRHGFKHCEQLVKELKS